MSIISTQNIGLGVASAIPLTQSQPASAQTPAQSALYTTPAGQLLTQAAIQRNTGKIQTDAERGGPQAAPNKRPEGAYAPQKEKKGSNGSPLRGALPGGRLVVEA